MRTMPVHAMTSVGTPMSYAPNAGADPEKTVPLADLLADTEGRLLQCHILAGNIRLAMYGPEPGADGKGELPPGGAMWSARRLNDSAAVLVKELNDILAAIESSGK